MIGNTRLVCVDGPAGSGKTTFAATMSRILSAPVVHMDDVYEGWEHTLEQSTWDRVVDGILKPLNEGKIAKPDIFDWHDQRFVAGPVIPAARALIIEGVGSAHPSISMFADDVIWVELTDEAHMERIIGRDGEAVRAPMAQFLLMQSAYFAAFDIRAKANLRLVSSSGKV